MVTGPRTHIRLGSGAEFDTIRSLLAIWGDAAQGIGDDCAVLDVPSGERLVVSTDSCVENVHFRTGWITPREIGYRAAAAALSDLAAMAARARGMLVSIALPGSWRPALEEIAAGIGDAARQADAPIVGGNMTTAIQLGITTTVLGSGVKLLSRADASEGDIVCVTGRLGGPAAALRSFEQGAKPEDVHRNRFVRPVPRVREGCWLADRGARAAIDVSDGLLADAAHVGAASGVTLVIDSDSVLRIPGTSVEDALTGGEEYELIVSFPAEIDQDRLTTEFAETFGIPLTVVGCAVSYRESYVELKTR